MTTDASIAKQVIQDEIESQINTAKTELEVLASQAEGTMVKAEVEAYEALMPKFQAIEQKLRQLKQATGAQWEQTKADHEVLIADFKANRDVPRSATEVPRLYLAQMALYRAALLKIYAGKDVDCALIWTDSALLMPLPDEVLDREMQRLAAISAA